MSDIHPIFASTIKTMSRASILACPHAIFEPSHYRPNGSCRCNDGSHTEMGEWGYKWNGKSWVAPDEEQP